MTRRLTVPPGTEDIFFTGIKRERIDGGLVRLYLYTNRRREFSLEGEMEALPERLEVIAILLCREETAEQFTSILQSKPATQDNPQLN